MSVIHCGTARSQEVADDLRARLALESVGELARAAQQQGDAMRGATLFFQPFLTCAKCHDSQTENPLGPDISQAGSEATPAHLVESVLAPSKQIKQGFETVVVSTVDGRLITGLLVRESDEFVELIEPAGNQRLVIARREIESRRQSSVSTMPDGLVNLLSDRQQFLDLTKYLIEIAEGGPNRARELRPAQSVVALPEYEQSIDHAGLIRAWDGQAYDRGQVIYTRVCANCHGTVEQPGSLPNSPQFATYAFKNGSDPYSLYRTLTHGYNSMAPQSWMVPRQKYDVIHFLRESFLREHNPAQYAAVDDHYLETLPVGTTVGPAPASVEPWMAMDYGPSLINTYEISSQGPNLAYKGIAMRLDPGSGGVSRGTHWALFDHDTLRFAAAWTGSGFIDWQGIHFDGQHQVHPKIVGDVHVEIPIGPGWADPQTGRFDDPRLRGRDSRPYGPLPPSWGRFLGTYAYGDQTIMSYTVGDATLLEVAGAEFDGAQQGVVFTRTLEVGQSSRDLTARIAPDTLAAHVIGDARVSLVTEGGFSVLKIPAATTPTRLKVLMSRSTKADLTRWAQVTPAPRPLEPLTHGGPKRWPEVLQGATRIGGNEGPFAVDSFDVPERNPWNALLRLTGLDFFPDGRRVAICTWDGDVWAVGGIDRPEGGLTWQRIASGLFQPLGLTFREGAIFVCCRDQIVKLHDLNGDGETDFYECFNNDHQVTEHFHEFAMGLQVDAAGNLYYAKSGRHALPALVPHHGTLLKVSRDGTSTEILATGFRAANGVCLNPDGTFFVTDQEGFWIPKNRINLVEPGGFYGNLWGYTEITDPSDAAMKHPLCWITNEFDRSPAELVWVPAETWGPLAGSLLNTSYGMGQIFVVPHETVDGQVQGGMCALPLNKFPTGIMRSRFHPGAGDLFVCGMFAWAGNQTVPGGLYRVRYTGLPIDLPIGLQAHVGQLKLIFTDPLDAVAISAEDFEIRVWGLERTQNYGSRHIGERTLAVVDATLGTDGKTVFLAIPDLAPTWCMEIKYRLTGAGGRRISGTIHNTIHRLSTE